MTELAGAELSCPDGLLEWAAEQSDRVLRAAVQCGLFLAFPCAGHNLRSRRTDTRVTSHRTSAVDRTRAPADESDVDIRLRAFVSYTELAERGQARLTGDTPPRWAAAVLGELPESTLSSTVWWWAAREAAAVRTVYGIDDPDEPFGGGLPPGWQDPFGHAQRDIADAEEALVRVRCVLSVQLKEPTRLGRVQVSALPTPHVR
jgi:hypothetical protein